MCLHTMQSLFIDMSSAGNDLVSSIIGKGRSTYISGCAEVLYSDYPSVPLLVSIAIFQSHACEFNEYFSQA